MKKIRVKVKVKKQYLSLKDILPFGFETELVVKLSTEEKLIYGGRPMYNKSTKTIITPPEFFAPIDNYEGYTFVGANGETYGDSLLYFYRLEDIFEKIDNV